MIQRDKLTGAPGDALEFVANWIPSKEIPWFLTRQECGHPSFIYIPGVFNIVVQDRLQLNLSL